MEGAKKFVAGRRNHDRDGQEKAELEGRSARHAYGLTGGNGRHGSRDPWKHSRRDLPQADPDRLEEGHLLHIFGLQIATHAQGIHQPHHDAANQQRPCHKAEAFQMLTD